MSLGIKMRSNITPIATHAFVASESLLIDTNVWLLLYGRQDPSDWRIKVYSKAFARISAAKCPIYIYALVLSEFINSYSRIEHKLAVAQGGPSIFKRFRESPEFLPIAQSIASACRIILKQCARTESQFESANIEAILKDYAAASRDFNDQILSHICRVKNLKMITDDADFEHLDIPVFTANRRLLH